MAQFTAIRDGLAARLATISGLAVYDTIPGQISVPAAVIGVPEQVEYDVSMARGADRWQIPIRVYVARADLPSAQDTLDGYLDSQSASGVKTAVEADPTLGGVAHTSRVVEARDYGEYRIGNVDYLGCEWLVEVIA